MEPEYKVIPLASIFPNPDQPRKTFDRDLLDELAASIKTEGLLQPVTVRETPAGFGADACYQLVAGERRWRASTIAGLTEIPARIVKADDQQTFILALLENTARANMNPMEEARAYERGLTLGFTKAELADRVGVGVAMLEWRLELLLCIESVQGLVERNQLAPSFATFMTKLSPNAQQKAIREYQLRRMTLNEYRTLVNALYADENAIDMFPEMKLSKATVEAGEQFRLQLQKIYDAAAAIQRMDKETLAPSLVQGVEKLEMEVNGVVIQLNGTMRFLQRLRARGLAAEMLAVKE